MSRRFIPMLAGLLVTLGAIAFASAQPATPTALPAMCASPVAATPEAIGSPVAACALSSFEIDAVDMAFLPNELTVPANTPVELRLVNKGIALHDFGIDALNINVDLVPGAAKTIIVTFAPGDYAFYCDIPIHPAGSMTGMLHAK